MRGRAGIMLMLWLVCCVASACSNGPLTPDPASALRAHIVLVTYTTGFRHSSIDVAEAVIPQLGRDSGVFTTSLCRTSDDVRTMLGPVGLSRFDGVVFANTTGNLGVPDLTGFLNWIAMGHGFAGMHSAADTYHDQPAYLEMIGNEFAMHGNQTEVEAIVESPSHPAVAHVAPRYRVFDEIYRFVKNNRGSVTPLLTLDRYPSDGLPDAGQPGDLPLAWTRMHGSGRVFYTALGHRDELWQDARYQQHVLGGIRWVLGR